MCVSEAHQPDDLPNAVKPSVNVFQSRALNTDAVHDGQCFAPDLKG